MTTTERVVFTIALAVIGVLVIVAPLLGYLA
jgi:hypothetical protein